MQKRIAAITLALVLCLSFTGCFGEDDSASPDQALSTTSTEKTTLSTTTATKTASEQMVWIPQTGSKYHSNENCSNMNDPSKVTLSEAVDQGFGPCKRCYK